MALAALRWILALLVFTDRAGGIEISIGTREITGYHGVEAARGRVIGDGRDPGIVLTVTPPPRLTCTRCTAGWKPKHSPTPARPSANPRCPSS